jgi:hypothetical protein
VSDVLGPPPNTLLPLAPLILLSSRLHLPSSSFVSKSSPPARPPSAASPPTTGPLLLQTSYTLIFSPVPPPPDSSNPNIDHQAPPPPSPLIHRLVRRCPPPNSATTSHLLSPPPINLFSTTAATPILRGRGRSVVLRLMLGSFNLQPIWMGLRGGSRDPAVGSGVEITLVFYENRIQHQLPMAGLPL